VPPKSDLKKVRSQVLARCIASKVRSYFFPKKNGIPSISFRKNADLPFSVGARGYVPATIWPTVLESVLSTPTDAPVQMRSVSLFVADRSDGLLTEFPSYCDTFEIQVAGRRRENLGTFPIPPEL
jgi:hypothetical protein